MESVVSRPGAGEGSSSSFGYASRRTPIRCRPVLVGLWAIVMTLAGFGAAFAGEPGDEVRPTNATARESYPGPDNTGVPAGTVLRRSGSIKVETDGQVIDGLDIVGCVLVSADDVVIRRSRIRCTDKYSIRTLDASNLLVEDVEIDGGGVNEAAVCCANYTLRRLDISNVIDGPRLADNTVVEDSWIHHLHRRAGSHNDTLQTTGATNMTIRRNALEAYHPGNDDPMNACLMIGSTTGPVVANLIFENNYCNGGNYSIGIRRDLNASNIRIRHNTFGRDHRYGVIAVPHPGVIWDEPSNIYLDNLRPVTD